MRRTECKRIAYSMSCSSRLYSPDSLSTFAFRGCILHTDSRVDGFCRSGEKYPSVSSPRRSWLLSPSPLLLPRSLSTVWILCKECNCSKRDRIVPVSCLGYFKTCIPFLSDVQLCSAVIVCQPELRGRCSNPHEKVLLNYYTRSTQPTGITTWLLLRCVVNE